MSKERRDRDSSSAPQRNGVNVYLGGRDTTSEVRIIRPRCYVTEGSIYKEYEDVELCRACMIRVYECQQAVMLQWCSPPPIRKSVPGIN